jgi:hypothetical protein
MKKQNMLKFALALALLAASTSLTWSQDKESGQLPNLLPSSMNTIEGVWAVTRHGVNCQNHQDMGPPFPALMTFHKDGTVSGQSYGPFPQNAYGPAEHGVWQHAPGNTFSYRLLSYSYDDNGQFTGSSVVTATGQLTSANTFTISASTIQVYDPNGNLLFTLCGRATATRFE